FWYIRKLKNIGYSLVSLSDFILQWRMLAGLGFAFMISSVSISVGNLFVRSIIQRELGSVELGYFQAAWVISMTYIGFVLTSMASDYYPRLTSIIEDKEKVCRLVNEQAQVAILLAGPILLGMLMLSEWVIGLLYTPDFHPAADLLRWQILGDIL